MVEGGIGLSGGCGHGIYEAAHFARRGAGAHLLGVVGTSAEIQLIFLEDLRLLSDHWKREELKYAVRITSISVL